MRQTTVNQKYFNDGFIPEHIKEKAKVIKRIEPAIDDSTALELATRPAEQIETAIVAIRENISNEEQTGSVIADKSILKQDEDIKTPEYAYKDLAEEKAIIPKTLSAINSDEGIQRVKQYIFFKGLF